MIHACPVSNFRLVGSRQARIFSSTARTVFPEVCRKRKPVGLLSRVPTPPGRIDAGIDCWREPVSTMESTFVRAPSPKYDKRTARMKFYLGKRVAWEAGEKRPVWESKINVHAAATTGKPSSVGSHCKDSGLSIFQYCSTSTSDSKPLQSMQIRKPRLKFGMRPRKAIAVRIPAAIASSPA